jgi:3-isopropylmalate/(R)-2-methylmalate dehydratase large subunit
MLWFKVPESMKFIFKGNLKRWVGGKDLILHTIGDIGVDGALYKAMEFTGDVISRLPMDDRLAMCNMAIEAGGKNGIIQPDDVTQNYLRNNLAYEVSKAKLKIASSDPDAEYCCVKTYDVNRIEPLVAMPYLPSNVKPVNKIKKVKIDQVVIGSCTNGRISDLRTAAYVMTNNKVHKGVRAIIIPATQKIYLQAAREGLMETFVRAGCAVSTPTCGPCLGGHMGVLGEGERAVATTNRNFIGRMGHPKSEVYLTNPAVAAASAIAGRIAHPDEVLL